MSGSAGAAATRPRPGSHEARFHNLVALVGTVTRCNCGKRGFLAKVGVSVEPAMRKKTYFAEWEHPHDDGDSSSLCEWVWP